PSECKSDGRTAYKSVFHGLALAHEMTAKKSRSVISSPPPARSVQARTRHFPPEFYVRRRSDECHRVGSVLAPPHPLRVDSAPALRDFSRLVHQTFLQTRWHIRCPVLRSETESPRLRSPHSDCAPSPDRQSTLILFWSVRAECC